MDSALLVKPDTVAAEKFLARLERSEFLVDAAFWLQYPDSGDWRLVVASPVIDYSRPKHAYQWIQRVLDSGRDGMGFQLSDISVVGNGDQVLDRLRGSLGHTKPEGWIRVHAPVISESSAGDALVFRLFPPSGPGPQVLQHETRFVSHVADSRLFWLVGGPSEWSLEPNDWRWCGYPQGMVVAQRKAQAINGRVRQRKAQVVKEVGPHQLAIIDNDGIHYVITTERNLDASGQTAWTSAVAREVPSGTEEDQVWQALVLLGSSARDAERTRVGKARGFGAIWENASGPSGS